MKRSHVLLLKAMLLAGVGSLSIMAAATGGVVLSWGNGLTPPPGLTDAVQVSVSSRGALILRATGDIIQIGISPDGTPLPTDLPKAKYVSAGFSSYAVRQDGTVVNWGSYPHDTSFAHDIVKIVQAQDNDIALGLQSDGKVVNLGRGSLQLPANMIATDVVCSSNYFAAVLTDGHVMATDTSGPILVPNLDNVKAITRGSADRFMALRNDGTVRTFWPYGNGRNNIDPAPVGLNDVVKIAQAADEFFAFKSNGDVVSWGHYPPHWDYIKPPVSLGNILSIEAFQSIYVYPGDPNMMAIVDSFFDFSLSNLQFVAGSRQCSVGTITLRTKRSQDIVINLSSSDARVNVPYSVTVPAGQKTATFPITSDVTDGNDPNYQVRITAQSGSSVVPRDLYAKHFEFIGAEVPPVVAGGQPFQAMLHFNAEPLQPITMNVAVKGPAASTHTVLLESDRVMADFVAFNVASDTKAILRIASPYFTSTPTYYPYAKAFTVAESPAAGLSVFVPTGILGNQRAYGTVTLDAPAPTGGIDVWLYSADPNATVPEEPIHINKGNTSRDFLIKTEDVGVQTTAQIAASSSVGVQGAIFSFKPMTINSVSFASASVAGGSTVDVTIKLAGVVRLDMPVNVTISPAALGSAPVTVVIPALKDSVTVPVQTNAVSTNKTLKLTATLHGKSKTATVKLTP